MSVINYSDTEGPRTLSDLFEKASRPERIFVGYVYQGNYEDEGMISSHLIFESEAISKWINSNVRVLFLHEKDATGPCYARHLCGQLWRNENFFLQTDSHMRFRPNWDNYLIELYKRIKVEQQTRPILTTYPLGYHLPNDIPKDTRPTILVSNHTKTVIYFLSLSFFSRSHGNSMKMECYDRKQPLSGTAAVTRSKRFLTSNLLCGQLDFLFLTLLFSIKCLIHLISLIFSLEKNL